MNNFIELMNKNAAFLIIALFVIVVIEFILIIIALSKIGGVKNKYKKMMRGVENKNLEQMIEEYFNKVSSIEENSKDVVTKFGALEADLKSCVQRVSVVRYKAFEDIGSDLSFSVALLDQNNDGVVLTGIYGRMESTTYAKPIDKGISRYDLSEEEMQALSEAMSK